MRSVIIFVLNFKFNNMTRIFICLFSVLLLVSCTTSKVEKIPNGVIIKLQSANNEEAKLIRLQVVNEKIIHVSATPGNKFSDEKSLAVLSGLEASASFGIEEKENAVVLSTDSLNVSVNTKSGEIVFRDQNGNIILAEEAGGGKSFAPIEVENTKGYSLHQIFESLNDEAFYGLGQHQSDEFNYKGKNESLFQYNTKVSVPFIVSNKNYGILWDNYSLSKFGDVRDYAQLDQFKLYDSEGKSGGLTATYTSKDDSQESVVRTESVLNYEDLSLVKNYPENFDLDKSTVVWSGEIEADESGTYRFLLYYAGYTTLYLNDELVVKERWRTAWNPNSYKFTYDLEKGKRIPIRIEWEPDGGVSYISLKALSPVPEKEQNKLSLWSEMGDEINYYFVYGSTMDDVIGGYRTITGKSQIMPKWAMGFWQSRERYKTQNELLETLGEFRKRKIPIDNIVQDWSYWPEAE